jgi:hypothetical protein
MHSPFRPSLIPITSTPPPLTRTASIVQATWVLRLSWEGLFTPRPLSPAPPPLRTRAHIADLEAALAAKAASLQQLEQRCARQARTLEDHSAMQDELDMLRPVAAELAKAEVRCTHTPHTHICTPTPTHAHTHAHKCTQCANHTFGMHSCMPCPFRLKYLHAMLAQTAHAHP